MSIRIRETSDADEEALRGIHETAFGPDEGPVVAGLTGDILRDPSARPVLSLVAEDAGRAVGHILFSAARLDGADSGTACSILAPLAVIPECRKRGVGGALIAAGVERLGDSGTGLVFVLGHPDYYTRHGFLPAWRDGFAPTYAISEKHRDAWMVRRLPPGAIGPSPGRVQCCAALDRPELWQA